MLEFYFPKLKAKKMAEPMTGKAYRARGGSIRYGLQAQHEGSISLPKYVPISEYESLGFSAEEAVAALPAYESKPAPVPADPTLDVPSASPEPVEPTNQNFSAEIEGEVNYLRQEEKIQTNEQNVIQNYIVDTDPEDIPEDKMDELKKEINYEIEDMVSKDPNHYDSMQDIDFITGTEVIDEDGDLRGVQVEGVVYEPQIKEEDNFKEDTSYRSYYHSENFSAEEDICFVCSNPDTEYDVTYCESDADCGKAICNGCRNKEMFKKGGKWVVLDEDPDDDNSATANVCRECADNNESVLFEATSGSGTIDHDRIDREEDVSVIMRHDHPHTDYDWDSDKDLSEQEEDELEDGIRQEVGSDPDEDDNDFYINVDTADGDTDVYVQTHTDYGSGRFYDFASESIHQFNGESSECCGEPIYRFKSEGDWLCMACDFMQAEFTPEELTESSAIHGDFDTASINYSGHQNLVAQAETKMKDGTYETTCDCGTVLTWFPGSFAKDKDGKIIRVKDITVEQLEFPSPMFDHFEEEISMECPTCGEYHTCEIEAPVYNDRLKVDFGAEERKRLSKQGRYVAGYDGIIFDDENNGSMVLEDGGVWLEGSIENEDYYGNCDSCSEDLDGYETGYVVSGSWSICMDCFDEMPGRKGVTIEMKNGEKRAEEPVIQEPDFIPEGDGRALGQQNSSINLSPLHAENSTYQEVMGMIEDLSDDDYTDFCYEMDINPEDTEELSSFVMSNYDSNRVMKFLKDKGMVEGYQSEGMSRNAKMALGFTAIGLGIAFWKGKDLMTLWDSVKDKLDK